jgi:two-component system sensor histidine kinase/response regulator
VESEPGKGSCFHFTVPLKFIASRAKADAPAGKSGLRGLRVLIVDDNVTNRKILQGLLDRRELRTLPVEGGEQAVKELIAAHRNQEYSGRGKAHWCTPAHYRHDRARHER